MPDAYQRPPAWALAFDLVRRRDRHRITATANSQENERSASALPPANARHTFSSE